MNATATNSTPSRPTAAEKFEEIAPLIAAPFVFGPPIVLLLGPGLLLVLLLIPPAAALLTLLVVLALLFAAAALVAAVLASPFLLVRALHRRLAERRQSSERSVAIASQTAQTRRATQQPGFAALAPSTTARQSR